MGRPKISGNSACLCGSNKKYKRCCGAYHRGEAAPTPLALMRSRYCAYALHLADYIMATTHPDGPHFQADAEVWREDVLEFSRGTAFEGLSILSAEHLPGAKTGRVTFRAQLSQGGRDVSFVEKSAFAVHEGRWKYVEGVAGEQ